MEIRTATADFSNPVQGSGPRQVTVPVIFSRNVLSAAVGITSYTVAFGNNDDHNLGQVQIKVDPTITANVVTVVATLGLRDWSGNWDDPYQGNIEFAVIADLQPANAPPPRGDIQVVDMELNQAVQFFRSASYLDPLHVQPDNSIYMVSKKDTGVRVYTDYDANAGLPPITHLTGSMVVTGSGTNLTLTPINPGGNISPHPDSTTNLSNANDTLNFWIPAEWCFGTVTITCVLWDADSPGSTSASFSRSITFIDVAPMNIYAVGVNYDAVTPNLPAPTQAAFLSQAMPGLTKTYPVGDIVINGYSTIHFSKIVTGNINNGCTDGFNSLLDKMKDMRGGTGDIYVAVLPAGIINTPGNQDGGCGDIGVAAIFIDYGGLGDLPHESGHALGRKHAPCNHGCNPAPANVDSNYPQYGSFPSDSIGVFGFDVSQNQVFNPANTFDFMSYSFPQWVSAYTYAALGGAFAPLSGSSGGTGAGHAHGIPGAKQSEQLMLTVQITRDRIVTRVPAFYFPAPGQGNVTCSSFLAELLGEDRGVLVCQQLACDCNKGCDCWPRTATANIPWQEGARWLCVWEGERKIYEEAIPDPAAVVINQPTQTQAGVEINWTVNSKGVASQPSSAYWFLVHWYDEEYGVWRGVAPRQQEHSLLIPANLFVKDTLTIRVLCSSGIATGYAETTLRFQGYKDVEPVLIIPGYSPSLKDETQVSGFVLTAYVLDQSGREADIKTIYWYDVHGKAIGYGSRLDLRQLKQGAQEVRVVVKKVGAGYLTESIRIRRSGNHFVFLSKN